MTQVLLTREWCHIGVLRRQGVSGLVVRAGIQVVTWKQSCTVWLDVRNAHSRKDRPRRAPVGRMQPNEAARRRNAYRLDRIQSEGFQEMWGMGTELCFSVTLWQHVGELTIRWAAGTSVWVFILQRLDEWRLPGVRAEIETLEHYGSYLLTHCHTENMGVDKQETNLTCRKKEMKAWAAWYRSTHTYSMSGKYCRLNLFGT